MKRKNVVGLIAIVAIVAAVIFAGCVEEETPTTTPTPVPTATPTVTSIPTSTPTPLPEPKYIPGDIIEEEEPITKTMRSIVISYDKETDKYEINYIFQNRDGTWGHFVSDDTTWHGREWFERYCPILVTHVDLSSITIGEPKISPTSTPTSKPKKWHSVTSFSGSDDKTTRWFTIKGDEWRIKYTVDPEAGDTEYSLFGAFVYPRGETARYVSSFDCDETYCSDTQYIYKGNGDYYILVISNCNSWKLEVEDYY